MPDLNEKHVQLFLEENVCLLPAPHGAFRQGHGNPLSQTVVSQPELSGLKCKVPDFMYFTGNSGEITAVFIEIESPNKKWFTKKNQQTAELTQASNQLTEWKAWFDDPANIIKFENDYRVRDYSPLNNRFFSQKYILVYGRRKDIGSPAANKQRQHLQRENEKWMTYDRLYVCHDFDDSPTVKLDRSGPDTQFRVMHIPSSFKLGPCQYKDYHELVGLEKSVHENKHISEERKIFLVDRLAYWKTWYESDHNVGAINGNDFLGE